MPPIPVYTKSPINAAKGSGVTPQTAAQDSFEKIQAPPPTTTTQATPTKTTSTYHLDGNNNNNNNNPPPPQPGAMPHLPQPTGTATTPSSYPHDGPPPPAPTAAAQLSGSNYSSAAFPPVPQTAIPAPSIPFNQRGTSTGMATPSRTGAAVLPGMSPYEHGPSGSGSGGYSVSAPYSSDGGQEGEGMLGSAMKFARTAGEKLSAAESEVWKRINGEK